MAKINIIDKEIEKEKLKYRLENLIFSQNTLNAWKYDREEFINKYIRGIYWTDDSKMDQVYEENMAFGRDFHLDCQRIFMDIDVDTSKDRDLLKVISIRDKYRKKYGHNVEFKTESSIMLKSKISIIADLIVMIYEDKKLKKIDIWDWKTETKEISQRAAIDRMQTKMYLYVVKNSLGKDLNFEDLKMYYMQVKIDKTSIVEYSESMHRENEKEIFDTIDEIKSLEVEACQ